jgi:anti-sigma factor RsiW
MTDCTRIGERLAAYTDDSLSVPEREVVAAHLARCVPCRRSADAAHAGRTLLRARAEQLRGAPLPPGLQSRCEALLREQAAPPPLSWRSRLVHAGIMALLVLLTGAAVLYVAATRSEAVLAAQVSADHDRCFSNFVGPNPADLDAAAVEADLAARFGFDVHVPPSSPEADVHLVHARRCLLGRAPHILYRTEGKDLSLYVLEGEDHGERDVIAFGNRARVWTRGATTFVLVSAADAGDLTAAVNYVRQELQ